MARAQYPITLSKKGKKVKGRITVVIDMTPAQRAIAESVGVGKEEQENLEGQELQNIIDILGLEEAGGVS